MDGDIRVFRVDIREELMEEPLVWVAEHVRLQDDFTQQEG